MRIVATFLALSLLAGCYTGRMTGNYEDFPELGASDDDSAILEEAGDDEEARSRNEARLREIAAEQEPVYLMNSGDMIEIRVYDHPDIGVKTLVGPDGMVGLAFMGQVKLGGLTIAEGTECIRKGLAPYVKNPVVSIAITDVKSETATITGSCQHPGVYGISNSTRLADFYAMAGSSAARLFNGVDVDAADLDHSILVRDGEILPIDFHKAIDRGDPLHNVRIRKDDYIFIAQRMEASIIICGEVNHPHKRLYEQGVGLIETLTVAGWMKETHWKHVIIIRNSLSNPKFYKVDVDGILAGKCRNVELKAGDIVYVPKDNISEYNVFVRKLMPTAQIVNLLSSRITAVSN